MKKSLFSISMAALLASTSATVFASTVTIPNTFVAGDTAVAADVNANFTAVKTSVDDNDSRITAETTRATTAEGVNATAIADETTRALAAEGANATAIADETTRALAAEGANATAITALQNPTCPTGMTQAGPLCVDIYEASVWDSAAGTGTQYGNGSDDYPCNDNAFDCSGVIFAVSKVSVTPSRFITWYQAAQACASVGKRLPTTAEYLMAANGTPAVVPADRASGCNVKGIAGGNFLGTTGESTGAPGACVSSTGAFDMLGSVWEWSANLANLPNVLAGFDETSADASEGLILGSAYNLGLVDTHSVSVADSGPTDSRSSIGFRCVK